MSTDGRTHDERLLTLEFSDEVDLLGGGVRNRIFLRLYAVQMREAGLFRALPAVEFLTLCALASYANADGICWPSQKTLARDLGCSRQAVARRIANLAKFRFNGMSLMMVRRQEQDQKGRFGHVQYLILPISGIRFGRNRVTPALHGAERASATGPVIHTGMPPCNTVPYTAHGDSKNNQTEEYVMEKWDVIHKRDSERSIPLPDGDLESVRRRFIESHGF